jgi:hypothetical protein
MSPRISGLQIIRAALDGAACREASRIFMPGDIFIPGDICMPGDISPECEAGSLELESTVPSVAEHAVKATSRLAADASCLVRKATA